MLLTELYKKRFKKGSSEKLPKADVDVRNGVLILNYIPLSSVAFVDLASLFGEIYSKTIISENGCTVIPVQTLIAGSYKLIIVDGGNMSILPVRI